MSFKDVRDLSEHLKLLGYPKVFPLQALSANCGTLASFTFLADILQWFAELLEPGTILAGGVNSVEERVLLIRSTVEFFITKAAIKLNPRKLYSASSAAALELQKITSILIIPRDNENNEAEEDNYLNQYHIDITDKMDNLRLARNLSSDLTKRAGVLHELLTKEVHNKEIRQNQTNKSMEMTAIERAIKNAISSAQLKVKANRVHLENSKSELAAMNSKLQRKRTEFERTKQRLEALQKIRPAHIQEFEECEKEISKLFEQYFLRLHVRDALLAQIEERAKLSVPAVMQIAQKPSENSIPLLPEGLLDDDIDNDDESEGVEILGESFHPEIRDPNSLHSKKHVEKRDERGSGLTGRKRPGSASHRKRTTTGRSLMSGTQLEGRTDRQSMLGNYKTHADNDDSSFGSESDLDIIDFIDRKTDSGLLEKLEGNTGLGLRDEDDDDLNFNSIDDISISKITNELSLRPKTANKPDHQSDEDF